MTPSKFRLADIPASPSGAGWLSRNVQWGGMNLAYYEHIPAGFDSRPYFNGLPGSMCQIGHWGYVLKGELLVTYYDREETVSEGEVYYCPPGHSAMHTKDTTMLELSPVREWETTMSVWKGNAGRAR